MRVLVDTSVWVEHFRGRPRAAALVDLLEDDRVALHSWVLGELVLGHLGSGASSIRADLERLPVARSVADKEVLEMIVARRLTGSGLGWVDAQLLASALSLDADLWTFDRKLADAAGRARLAPDL